MERTKRFLFALALAGLSTLPLRAGAERATDAEIINNVRRVSKPAVSQPGSLKITTHAQVHEVARPIQPLHQGSTRTRRLHKAQLADRGVSESPGGQHPNRRATPKRTSTSDLKKEEIALLREHSLASRSNWQLNNNSLRPNNARSAYCGSALEEQKTLVRTGNTRLRSWA